MKKKFLTDHELVIFNIIATYTSGYMTCEMHHKDNVSVWILILLYILTLVWVLSSLAWQFSCLNCLKSTRELVKLYSTQTKLDQDLIDATQDFIVGKEVISLEDVKKLQEGLREIIAKRKNMEASR